jgi:hypothetical protein
MATTDELLIDFIRTKKQSLPSLSGEDLDLLLHELKYRFPTAFQEITNAHILDDARDTEVLKNNLTKFFTNIEERLPQLSTEPADTSMPREEIAERTRLYREAKMRSNDRIEEKRTVVTNKRRTFIQELVKNFEEQTRAAIQKEAEAASITSPEEARKLERSLVDKLQVSDAEKRDTLSTIEKNVRDVRNDYLQEEAHYQKTDKTLKLVQQEILEGQNPPIHTTNFIDTAVKLTETTTLSPERILTQAGQTTRIQEAVSMDTTTLSLGGHGFFQKTAGSRLAEKTLAPVADLIFDNLKPNEQIAVLREVFTKSLDRIEDTTLKTGKFIAESRVLKNALLVGDYKTSPQSLGVAVQKISSDFFQSFRGIDEQTFQVMQVMYMNAASPDWAAAEHTKQLFAQIMYSGAHRVFNATLKKGGKWALKEGAKQVVKKTASDAIGEFLGGALASIFGPEAVPIGVAIGKLIGPVIDAAINITTRAATLALNGAGTVLTTIMEGKEMSLLDTALLLPIIIVGVLVLFFLFPSIFNISNFQEDTKTRALSESMVAGGILGPDRSGAPQGEVVIWSYAGDPPVSDAPTDSPVRGGICTQGPYGSFSHKGIKAYDFANSQGAPVFATHDGYVVSYHDGIPPYTFINSSYGNYVLLVGKTPSGAKFFTMYAHLLSVDPVVAAAAGKPIVIHRGQQVGTEDATGSTYGSNIGGTGIHLHYQYQGPGELSLPYTCQ